MSGGWDSDLQSYVAELDALSTKAKDLTPGFRGPVHEAVLQVHREAFDTEGASTARGRWEPRMPPTHGGKILHLTGDLEKSYTDPGHPDHLFRAEPDLVEVGSSHELASYHHTGTRRVPRRSVQLTDEQAGGVVQALWDWLLADVEVD